MKYLSLLITCLAVLSGCASDPHLAKQSEIYELVNKQGKTQDEEDRLIALLQNKEVDQVKRERVLDDQKASQIQANRRVRIAESKEQDRIQSAQIQAEIQRARLIYDPMSEQELIAIAKQDAANSLKDPGSANFRNVRVIRKPDRKLVCGDVNGKNSFGGYSGYQPFMWGYLRQVSIFNPNPTNELERFQYDTLMSACR